MKKFAQYAFGIAVGLTGALLLGESNLKLSVVLGVAFTVIGALMLIKKRKRNGVIGVILIPALLTLPINTHAAEPEQPIRPAGAIVLGVGIGLIVGCGYIAYRVVDQCAKNKKNLPPPPAPRNTNDGSFAFAAYAGEPDCDYYSGSYLWQTDYCSIEVDDLFGWEPLPPPVFHGVTLTITIGSDGLAKVDSVKHHNDSELISFEESKAAMLRDYGITWNGHGGELQTTKNGTRTDRNMVPFTINQSPVDPLVTVYPDRPQHRFYVELSTDGIVYNRLAHISMPSGQTLLFQDVRDTPQAFYRVVTE